VKLLLLDEPTSNLDPTGKSEVEQVLGELIAEDLALLIVTHDISLALRTAQRIVIMSQGAISWSGETGNESMLSELERGYGCSFLRIDHADLHGPLIVAR
jgi:ABC-type polar amino acid transport system ATPase subunit